MKRIFALMLALVICLGAAAPVLAGPEGKDLTILFTHDLHSHLLPSRSEDGGEYGGYARLMTVIDQQRGINPNALLVDAGDFSMGSLFQTAYATSAIELRMMGAMGYDATTFGNHEFDYLPSGFGRMLNTAVASGDPLPAIVEANYYPPKAGEEGYDDDSAFVWDALENYGVEEYTIIQRGGVCYALFGLTGYDSDDCAPNSGMILEDPIEAAQRTVDAAVAECRAKYSQDPVVIALSHSGTEDGEGEDYELAKAVDGIHLLVSGHTHTTLHEPIMVNDTYIVSAGEYGKYLGVVEFEWIAWKDRPVLKNYELIPIDESVEEDPEIADMVGRFKWDVDDYLAPYGVVFDQVLTTNPYEFDNVKEVKNTAHESTLGNLFSDAYKWAVEQATGEPVDVALTASGVIRETIPVGDVTVSDVFNAASLGVGTEGELVKIWLTGADLKTVFEVDASVYPLMNSAQLFCSGAAYSFNTSRMIFNKVDYAMLRRNDGTLEEIQDDKLYSVVTGMYAGQMLGSVEETSMGLLTITPRDEAGEPIDRDDLAQYVVCNGSAVPVKEWYAIASYLQQMGGEMDGQYARPDGRKVVYSSLKPADLLRNANHFTYILIGAVAVLVLIVVLVVRAVIRRKRK